MVAANNPHSPARRPTPPNPPPPPRPLPPVRISAQGSYLKGREKEYRIRVKLGVEYVQEAAEPDEEVEEGGAGPEHMVEAPRAAVAMDVLIALCECTAGIRGGCHHVGMVLILCRLLQLTEDELVAFNPETVTGRACQWIVRNCRGGRTVSQCPWYGKPLSQVMPEIRSVRDPKGMSRLEDDAPVEVRGVTPIDRQNDFNPHPTGGKWIEQKLYFDGGVTISKTQRDKLSAFVDGERSSPHQKVALDFLPPRVREDCP